MDVGSERSSTVSERISSDRLSKEENDPHIASDDFHTTRSVDIETTRSNICLFNEQQFTHNSTVTSSVIANSHIAPGTWEYWYLDKELAFRAHKQKQILQKKVERESVKRKLESEIKQKQVASTVHKEWVEQKNKMYMRKKVRDKRKEKHQKAIIEAENKRKKERAEQEYSRWVEFKSRLETESKRMKELGMEEMAKIEKERKEKCAAAFNAWLKRNPKKTQPTRDKSDLDTEKLIGRLLL